MTKSERFVSFLGTEIAVRNTDLFRYVSGLGNVSFELVSERQLCQDGNLPLPKDI